MKTNGIIYRIDETQTIGSSNFRKRELILETQDQYKQYLRIEFIQDKCDILNNYKKGDNVEISINLEGRLWTSPEGQEVCFTTLKGWRIENFQATPTNDIETTYEKVEPTDQGANDLDLPF